MSRSISDWGGNIAAFGIFSNQSATPAVAGAAATLSMLAALLAMLALIAMVGRRVTPPVTRAP